MQRTPWTGASVSSMRDRRTYLRDARGYQKANAPKLPFERRPCTFMQLRRVLAAAWLALALPLIESCAPLGGAISTPGDYATAGPSTSAGASASSAPYPAAQADQVKPISVGNMSDAELSRRLTDWLHSHRLPLVGTQVYTASDGQRQVILYGFVATSYGKQDAEQQVRQLLGNEGLALSNRIAIRPELATQSTVPPATVPPLESGPMALSEDQAGTGLPGVRAYQQQQQQPAGTGWTADLLPVLMFAAMIGLSFVGGGAAAYPGVFPGFP